MMYQGGKTKLAPRLRDVMLATTDCRSRYVEPFLGSAAVAELMVEHFDSAELSDAMPDIAHLWRAAASGWIPPDHLTREEYAALRSSEPSALRAFAGFPCSFGGKWFAGYAPRADRNYAAQGSRSIARRGPRLAAATIERRGYEVVSAVAGDVIYCDPPYADTTGYGGVGRFDSEAFWRTADEWAQAGAVVFVSEYSAPDSWVPILEIDRHSPMAIGSAARAVERLYVPRAC